MSNDYTTGFLDGYLLTKDVVERILEKARLKKDQREKLTNELRFIREQILADRISDIRRQLEML